MRGTYLCPVKYVLLVIGAYVLYQLIFKLVLPVYKATQKIKKGFGDMHNRMNEQMQEPQPVQPERSSASVKIPEDDYIEFEEVK